MKQKQLGLRVCEGSDGGGKKEVWFLGFFSSCQHKDRHRIHFWVARCKKGVGSKEHKFFGDW